MRDRTLPAQDETPDSSAYKERISTEAVRLGNIFTAREDESVQEQHARIMEWSATQTYYGPKDPKAAEPENRLFRYKRLPQSVGCQKDVAVFEVKAPRQPVWPTHLKRPPIMPGFKAASFKGQDINSILN